MKCKYFDIKKKEGIYGFFACSLSATSGGNRTPEAEAQSSVSKPTREETAAQLAHAAVAHLNNRQGFVGVQPPQQQVSGPAPPPPPPPTVSQTGRTQLPNQQQQYLYQPGVLPPQGQQNLGPAPRLPPVASNIAYQGDPYQQQQQFKFM